MLQTAVGDERNTEGWCTGEAIDGASALGLIYIPHEHLLICFFRPPLMVMRLVQVGFVKSRFRAKMFDFQLCIRTPRIQTSLVVQCDSRMGPLSALHEEAQRKPTMMQPVLSVC